LGALEVTWNDTPVALGSLRPQILLARLLLARNRVVSTEELLDVLWPNEPPGPAEVALRSLVSRLRKRLRDAGVDREVIGTKPPGYIVSLNDDELDAVHFESEVTSARALMATGDAAGASAVFTKALSQWNGAAYGDIASEGFARAEAARLEELRLTSLEERIDAELGLGRHRELVGELEVLTTEHPLRERLWAQRMLALYRSGRQAEALHAYQAVRALLDDELGLSPSPMLMQLESEILQQSAALDLAPPPAPRTIVQNGPSGAAVAEQPSDALLGRDAEVDHLLVWWEECDGGAATVAFICGEPGIGKTMLAENFGQLATGNGALTLHGGCEEETAVPFQPFVDVLREYVATVPPEQLRDLLGWRIGELSRVLPELGERPDSGVGDPETERYRFFEAVTTLLVQAAQNRRVVIILDDLQWADKPTLLLLRHLLRASRPTGPFIVVAYRDTDLSSTHPLRELLHDLSRQSQLRRIALTGLDEQTVSQLVERHRGAEELWDVERLAGDLFRITEGNPLFTTEMIRHLQERNDGGVLGRVPVDLVVPEGVQDLIGRRISRLSADTNRLLTVASVFGREFPCEVAGRAADLTGDDLFEALEDAVVARVIAEVPGRDDWYSFTHSLVRKALYDGLLSSRRVRMHLRLAEILEEFVSTQGEPHFVELAYHYGQAGAAGDRRKAIMYSTTAGNRAQTQLAFEEACEHYHRALDILSELNDGLPEERCDLLLLLGEALSRSGEGLAGSDAYDEAIAIARSLGDAGRLARASLREGPLRYVGRVAPSPEEIGLVRDAREALGEVDSALLANVTARLALVLMYSGGEEEARALSQAAVDMARRIGDTHALGYTLNSRLHALAGPHLSDARREVASELKGVAQSTGDQLLALLACMWEVRELLSIADVEGTARVTPVLDRLAEVTRHPLFLAYARWVRSGLAMVRGDLADAERLAGEGLTLAERHDELALSFYGAQMLWTWWQKDVLPTMEAAFNAILEQAPSDYAITRAALALLLSETGRIDGARGQLQRLSVGQFAAVADDQTDGLAMAVLAPVCEATGDGDAAKLLYARMEPYTGRMITVRPPSGVCFGPADHYLGLFAAARDDLPLARHHLEASLEMARRVNALAFTAATRAELGGVLLRLNDAVEARVHLDTARTTAAALGLSRITRRVDALDAAHR
jgi:DNA-binding SARP family transcriptional activator